MRERGGGTERVVKGKQDRKKERVLRGTVRENKGRLVKGTREKK